MERKTYYSDSLVDLKILFESLGVSSLRWYFLDFLVETDYTHANSQQTSKQRPVNSHAVVSTYQIHGCTENLSLPLQYIFFLNAIKMD